MNTVRAIDNIPWCLFAIFMTACVLIPVQLRAQSDAGVHLLIVSSDGAGRITAPGSEAGSGEIRKAVEEVFGSQVRASLSVTMSSQSSSPYRRAMADFTSYCDSSDVLLSVWIGAWRADTAHAECSAFAGSGTPELSAEYFLNCSQFARAKNSLTIVLAPQRFCFPPEVSKEFPASAASGGKHILFVAARERMAYPSLVNALADAFRGMALRGALDANSDGIVTIGEWLRGFQASTRQQKIALTMMWLDQSSDIPFMINQGSVRP